MPAVCGRGSLEPSCLKIAYPSFALIQVVDALTRRAESAKVIYRAIPPCLVTWEVAWILEANGVEDESSKGTHLSARNGCNKPLPGLHPSIEVTLQDMEEASQGITTRVLDLGSGSGEWTGRRGHMFFQHQWARMVIFSSSAPPVARLGGSDHRY